jgi:hypothetical protein
MFVQRELDLEEKIEGKTKERKMNGVRKKTDNGEGGFVRVCVCVCVCERERERCSKPKESVKKREG